MCAHISGQASSRVHICATEYWQLVTTCTYDNLSRINAHHRSQRNIATYSGDLNSEFGIQMVQNSSLAKWFVIQAMT